MKVKPIVKRPNCEESRAILTLLPLLGEAAREGDQLPFCEESKKPERKMPTKPTNKSCREREYLTKNEIYSLTTAARKTGRYQRRDATMILLAYRHGLRVGELIDLKWQQVDFENGKIHVNRLKNGDASVQLLEGDEMRFLRELLRSSTSPFVFSSERGANLTARAFQLIVARAGKVAGLAFPVHPHMLRHSAGYALANAGTDTRSIQAFLGHKNIAHTVSYTALCSERFNGFGKVLQ